MTGRARAGHFYRNLLSCVDSLDYVCRPTLPEITKLPSSHSKPVRNCGVTESKVKPEPISPAKHLLSQLLISSPVHWPRPKASDGLTVCTEQNCLCFQTPQKHNHE